MTTTTDTTDTTDAAFASLPAPEQQWRAQERAIPLPAWSELCPNGRHIFYEGDDPQGFVAEIKERFGFDPSRDPRWAEPIPMSDIGPGFISYAFHCPARLLDELYGEY